MGTVRKLGVLLDTSSPGREVCKWMTVAFMFRAERIHTRHGMWGWQPTLFHSALLKEIQYSFLSYAFIVVKYTLKFYHFNQFKCTIQWH